MDRFRSLVLTTVLLAGVCAVAGEPAAREGETKLSAADAQRVLSELPAFKNPQGLKAKVVAEVEDLMGSRKEEGELLLVPPGKVLRNFTKPKPKVWLLNDSTLTEYVPALKTAYIKDFSGAPKALKRIQNAFTGDFKSLGELFAIHVFSSAEGKAYRFVLVPAQGESAAGYKRIQAKLAADAIFFHEIAYDPESGDKVVERFSEIAPMPRPDAAAFELKLPEDVTRKVDKVSDN